MYVPKDFLSFFEDRSNENWNLTLIHSIDKFPTPLYHIQINYLLLEMATRAGLMRQLMKGGFPKRIEIKPANREAAKKTKWNILRGDTVQVIERNHPEYGKQGIVKVVDRKRDRVIVEGLNTAPKHVKPDPDRGLSGRTIIVERSIHYSNVNLVDPVTNLPTRVSRKILEDGKKVRVAKKSGAIIPRPEILSQRRRPKSATVTPSDTSDIDVVWEISYTPKQDVIMKES